MPKDDDVTLGEVYRQVISTKQDLGRQLDGLNSKIDNEVKELRETVNEKVSKDTYDAHLVRLIEQFQDIKNRSNWAINLVAVVVVGAAVAAIVALARGI